MYHSIFIIESESKNDQTNYLAFYESFQIGSFCNALALYSECKQQFTKTFVRHEYSEYNQLFLLSNVCLNQNIGTYVLQLSTCMCFIYLCLLYTTQAGICTVQGIIAVPALLRQTIYFLVLEPPTLPDEAALRLPSLSNPVTANFPQEFRDA